MISKSRELLEHEMGGEHITQGSDPVLVSNAAERVIDGLLKQREAADITYKRLRDSEITLQQRIEELERDIALVGATLNKTLDEYPQAQQRERYRDRLDRMVAAMGGYVDDQYQAENCVKDAKLLLAAIDAEIEKLR